METLYDYRRGDYIVHRVFNHGFALMRVLAGHRERSFVVPQVDIHDSLFTDIGDVTCGDFRPLRFLSPRDGDFISQCVLMHRSRRTSHLPDHVIRLHNQVLPNRDAFAFSGTPMVVFWDEIENVLSQAIRPVIG